MGLESGLAVYAPKPIIWPTDTGCPEWGSKMELELSSKFDSITRVMEASLERSKLRVVAEKRKDCLAYLHTRKWVRWGRSDISHRKRKSLTRQMIA